MMRAHVAILIAIASAVSSALAGPPPNVVLIVVDDLGYGDVGCYGSKAHQTPHIDALAAGGLRLTDFHTNAPVCSPTRAALMTGRYQQRSGIESAIAFNRSEGVPLAEKTIAELLAGRGYVSGVFGKWHLGHVSRFGPNDQGFAVSRVSNNSPDFHTHVSRVGELDWFHNHEPDDEPGYLTDLITNHTVDFIRENRERPFFAYVSHVAVHFPFQGPNDPPHRTLGKIWHDTKYGPLPRSEYRRAYRDMLEAVDAGVGKVIATLDELDLRNNTLVIVTSDNGAYDWVGSNGPFRGQKGDLYEGGHRVPAIFNWPGRIEPGVSDELALTMDILPTLVRLAGAERPDGLVLDGVDLSDLLLKGRTLPKRTVFWRFNNSYTGKHAFAVRDGKFKLVSLDGNRELFDLDNDPSEKRDVSGERRDVVDRLASAFDDWESTVDPKAKGAAR